MHVAEPVLSPWNAQLALGFRREAGGTVLRERRSEGPLVVQRPFYPEGGEVCHTVVVHPPGGIAGGDALVLSARADAGASALLTTPGAAKWYRSSGALATQELCFDVDGTLEWLPRETIVFDGAFARLGSRIGLRDDGCFIGWEILCLERFAKGSVRVETEVSRNGKRLWVERGKLDGAGLLRRSAAGLGAKPVFGTLLAAAPRFSPELLAACRNAAPQAAVTLVSGVLVARYLGDESERAMECFAHLWAVLRPELIGKPAVAPRIWST